MTASLVSMLPLYGRSLLKTGRAVSHWPTLSLRRTGMTIDQAHLKRYLEVCGYPPVLDQLPPCYLQVCAFDAHMALLTEPAFPLRLLGLVHLGNTIRQHAELTPLDVFDLDISLGSLETNHLGHVFSVLTVASRAGRVVWESDMAILSRARTGVPKPEKTPEPPFVPAETLDLGTVPEDMGRRYARVSGDYNPIHLTRATARLFGFPRQIVHGMWTKARALAALPESWRNGPFEVQVRFRKPVLLPAHLTLQSAVRQGAGTFRVTDDTGQIVHLTGEIRRPGA